MPWAIPRARWQGLGRSWWAATSPFACWTPRTAGRARTWSSTLAPRRPEVVLAPPATNQALFPGCTLQPLGEGFLLAFLAGAAPPGLLASLEAFFPVEDAPPLDQPEAHDEPEPWAGDLDLGLELDADEDDEYLLS